MTDTVELSLQKIWNDFNVKDSTLYSTQLVLNDITASEKAKLIALNFFGRYTGYTGTAYGEGSYDTGLTEQQEFDLWEETFNNQQQLAKKQLINAGISTLPQNVYDGLILLYWATGKVLVVQNNSIEYRLLNPLKNKNYDTVADMIINSSNNKILCSTIATVLRLADYGTPKDRTWHRRNGVFAMRTANEKGLLDDTSLKKARFAYYAETIKFLPFTPEGKQRQVVKDYESTLVTQVFTYDGTNTFTLEAAPSMSPMEKLSVTINNKLLQHLYDFTVDSFTLTITESINTGDIIKTVVKI